MEQSNRRGARRRIAAILAGVMLVPAALLAFPPEAAAAGPSNVSSVSNDTFAALSLQTDTGDVEAMIASGAPTTEDPIALNTVSELFVGAAGNVYDFTSQSPTGLPAATKTIKSSFSGENTHVRSVAFDPDGDAKKNYVAQVCGVSGSKTTSLYLNAVDGTTGKSSSTAIGMYSFPITYHDAGAFLSITAGDFDGDGKDEVAVLTAGAAAYPGGPKVLPGPQAVEIYRVDTAGNGSFTLLKSQTVQNLTTGRQPAVPFLYDGEYESGSKAYEYFSVNLAAIPAAGDARDALAIAASYTRHAEKSKYATAARGNNTYGSSVISFWYDIGGDSERLATEALEDRWSSSYGTDDAANPHFEQMLFPSVAAGDINNDGAPEVVVAGYRIKEAASYHGSRSLDKERFLITHYAYDGTNFAKQAPMQWVDMKRGGAHGSAADLGNGIFNNSGDYGQNPLALTIFAERGSAYAKSVFAGGYVLALPDPTRAGLGDTSEYAMGMYGGYDTNPDQLAAGSSDPNAVFRIRYATPLYSSIDANRSSAQNRAVAEAVAGNFTNNPDGREQVAFTYFIKRQGSAKYDADLCFLYLKGQATDEVENANGAIPSVVAFWHNLVYNETKAAPLTVAAPDVHNDSTIVKYDKAKAPAFYFSDPQISAVLQAAPYFGELQYDGSPDTVITRTNGKDETLDHAVTVTAGTLFGIDVAVSGGAGASVELFEFELMAKFSASAGWQNQTTYTHSTSTSYSTGSNDTVVLTMTPYVRYYYQQWNPGAGKWESAFVDVPSAPRLSQVSVDAYDRIAGDNGWRTIRDRVFGGSVAGDPGTYGSAMPETWNIYDKKNAAREVWFDTNGNTGAKTRSINHEQSHGNGVTWGASVELEGTIKVVAGKGGLHGGVAYTGGYMWSQFEAVNYEGTVPNIADADAATYGFEWDFGTWFTKMSDSRENVRILSDYLDNTDQDHVKDIVEEQGLDTLVLGYRVKNAKRPPKAPEVSVDGTTEDSVTLAWKPVASPDVVNYEVGQIDLGATYLIATVDQATGGVFRYTDSPLLSTTTYQYVVRAWGYSNGTLVAGAWSDPVSARTNMTGVTATVAPDPLELRAGQSGTFTVTPPTGATGVAYQWQHRKASGMWQDLTGATGASLTVADAGIADEGEYRCVLEGRIFGLNGMTVYSDAATLAIVKLETQTTLAVAPQTGIASDTTETSATVERPYAAQVLLKWGTGSYELFTSPEIVNASGDNHIILKDDNGYHVLGAFENGVTATNRGTTPTLADIQGIIDAAQSGQQAGSNDFGTTVPADMTQWVVQWEADNPGYYLQMSTAISQVAPRFYNYTDGKSPYGDSFTPEILNGEPDEIVTGTFKLTDTYTTPSQTSELYHARFDGWSADHRLYVTDVPSDFYIADYPYPYLYTLYTPYGNTSIAGDGTLVYPDTIDFVDWDRLAGNQGTNVLGYSSVDDQRIDSSSLLGLTVPMTGSLLESELVTTPGDEVTLTATLAGKNHTETPRGTVIFTVSDKSTGAVAARLSGELDAGGQATATFTAPYAGSFIVTANYGGNDQFYPSSDSFNAYHASSPSKSSWLTLNPDKTAITYGEEVTFAPELWTMVAGGAPTSAVVASADTVYSVTLDGEDVKLLDEGSGASRIPGAMNVPGVFTPRESGVYTVTASYTPVDEMYTASAVITVAKKTLTVTAGYSGPVTANMQVQGYDGLYASFDWTETINATRIEGLAPGDSAGGWLFACELETAMPGLGVFRPIGTHTISVRPNETWAAAHAELAKKYDVVLVPGTFTVLPPFYSITYNAGANGALAVSTGGGAPLATGATVPYGSALAFVANPDPGFVVDSWTVTVGGVDRSADYSAVNAITVDATGDVSVGVAFAQKTALVFADSDAYDIPSSTVGLAVSPVDVSAGVSGGVRPYTFAATGLPDGVSISAEGVIGGTPLSAAAGGTAAITVTDYEGSTASIEIAYGSASAAPNPILGGSATIDGTLRYGETLTAVTADLACTPPVADLGTLAYQWRSLEGGASADLPGETGPTHAITGDDIGKRISVTVSAANCADAYSASQIASAWTDLVGKGIPANAAGSAGVTYAGDGFDLTAIGGLFTLDPGAGARTHTIEAGGTGEGMIGPDGKTLTATRAGTFAIGLETAETATHEAGLKTVAQLVVVKGAQAAPTGHGAADATTHGGSDGKITGLAANTTHEYSKDGGPHSAAMSNAAGEITGLSAGAYTVRLAATDLYDASPDSAPVAISHPPAPDTTPPTGEIAIGLNQWSSFAGNAGFSVFSRNAQTVVVTADDDVAVDSVEAFTSGTAYASAAAIPSDAAWVAYTAPFALLPDAKVYVYVKITDTSGNATYLRSDGIVLYTDSAADTAAISHTKGTGQDKAATVVLNGNTVAGVKSGNDPLAAGSDYTVVAQQGAATITFAGAWLESLQPGEHTLEIRYNPQGEAYVNGPGNDEPATTAILLTVTSPLGPATYTLIVNNGTGGGDYPAGAQAAITADAPPAGKVFDQWTGGNGGVFDDATSANTIFTMPANTAAVTAAYKDAIVPFVPVAGITGVPDTATVGTPLTLSGTVEPANATNTAVAWSVKQAGSTGATISGDTLETTAPGVLVVTATISGGAAQSADYAQDFTITVVAGAPAPSAEKDVVSVGSPPGAVIGVDTITGNVPHGTTSLTIDLAVSAGATWRLCGDVGCASEIADKTLSPLAEGDNVAYVEVTAEDGTTRTYRLILTRAAASAVLVTGIDVTSAGGATTITTDGGTLALHATVTPADATNKAVSWTSSDTAIAAVGADGTVAAVANGTVTIRATAQDGSGVWGEITLAITGQSGAPVPFVPVSGITGVPDTATAGVPLTLSGTVEPVGATNRAIVWSVKSAGTTGATIAGDILEATAPGALVITATVAGGAAPSADYAQDFAIAVAAGPPAPSSDKDVISVGSPSGAVIGADTITGNVPHGTTSLTIDLAVSPGATWRLCGDASCASEIADKTLSPLAVGANTAWVEVTAEDGTTKTYRLTVTRAAASAVPVTGIDVTSAGGATTIATDGGTLALQAIITPADATNKAVVWTSSDPAVATVEATGAAASTAEGNATVTAAANGTVTIRATAQDGSGVSGEITLTISGQKDADDGGGGNGNDPDPGAGRLPWTGGGTVPAASLAILFLALGTSMILVSRKRRQHTHR
ncbi:MAG: Ig-like domain-containing protein [Bifidobacteriaceae bacterium]|nr:Ig-like domain-containing protein [Bifidobacteriaceae bacterium]